MKRRELLSGLASTGVAMTLGAQEGCAPPASGQKVFCYAFPSADTGFDAERQAKDA